MISSASINIDKFPIVLYTTGNCIDNGRKDSEGGWGFVLLWNNLEYYRSGYEKSTTNNRMEMIAVIQGLLEIKNKRGGLKEGNVLVISDSKYVTDGITDLYIWQKYGWRMRENEDDKSSQSVNLDLWKEMLDLCQVVNPTFLWVKGHSGNKYNELCDLMADTSITLRREYSNKVRNSV
jgi:ribonuclease HI